MVINLSVNHLIILSTERYREDFIIYFLGMLVDKKFTLLMSPFLILHILRMYLTYHHKYMLDVKEIYDYLSAFEWEALKQEQS